MKYLWKIIVIILPIVARSEEFVVGRLQGQLGNQMFQIAAATALAYENGAKVLFPDLYSEIEWAIPLNRENIFFRLDASEPTEPIAYTYTEPYCHYQKIPYQKNMMINGYFQSEKYFQKYKELICDMFAPSDAITSYLMTKYPEIIEHPKTVSIHFREYRREDPEQKCHPNCTIEYYLAAIEKFSEDALFVVFSNNIAWCKENFLSISRNFLFIEGEHFQHDFYLMSLCKSHIISNSSFSWWAAYLNQNPDKVVIAPKTWFAVGYKKDTFDIIPEEWMLLPTQCHHQNRNIGWSDSFEP
jgi:hypothetical protein